MLAQVILRTMFFLSLGATVTADIQLLLPLRLEAISLRSESMGVELDTLLVISSPLAWVLV